VLALACATGNATHCAMPYGVLLSDKPWL